MPLTENSARVSWQLALLAVPWFMVGAILSVGRENGTEKEQERRGVTVSLKRIELVKCGSVFLNVS